MPTEFTRLILRQGIENERQDVVFRSGEPIYTTDYKRVFIGDDTTQGGIPVGMKFLGFCEFDSNSNTVFNVRPGYTGDIIFETTTNLLYVLSGDDFRNKLNYLSINKTPTPDNLTIFNNSGQLSLIPNSLDFSYVANYSIGRGLEKYNNVYIRMKTPGSGLGFTDQGVLEISEFGVTNDKLAPMEKDTVKARLGLGGSPSDVTLKEFANAISEFVIQSSSVGAVGVPIGTIIDYAGATPPAGYLRCDGASYLIADYPKLAQTLGNTWGQQTATTFYVPNLMGRTTVGYGTNYFTGTSSVNTSVLGSYGGTFSVELTRGNIPRHTHEFRINLPRDTESPAITGSQVTPTWGITDGGPDLGNFGSVFGQPHSNLQPSAVVNKIIKAK